MNKFVPKIFFSSSPRNEKSLEAWEQFFRYSRIGYKTDRKRFHANFRASNLAVIFGSWKKVKTPHHKVKLAVMERYPNFICCETSLLGRGKVTEAFNEDWFRIGLNTFLANSGSFNSTDKIKPDRWEMIRSTRQIEMLPWKPGSGKYITVCLQLPSDASLEGNNISLWMLNQCKTIRKQTDFPIKIRLPQLKRDFDPACIEEASSMKNVILEQGTRENLHKTIDDSLFVSTYSSGMAIDALLRGTPICIESKAGFAYAARTSLDQALQSNFNRPDRTTLLSQLAYCQWNIEEIEAGLPWKHLVQQNKAFMSSSPKERFSQPINP